MASILSYVPVVNRLLNTKDASRSIEIPPVEIHNVETAPEKRPRTLKHLLRANHINHAILFNDMRFHNHLPHILCSAYLLGASDTQMHHVYAEEAKTLEPWEPSPAEVTQEDWQSFWGDKRYQRAFIDFFEDSLVMRHNYNWKKLVDEYLYDGKEPLLNCLIGGLGHPLIHLGYAYEMDNKEVAIEALGLASTEYDFLHKYLDDPSYTKPSPLKTSNILDLLTQMASDKRVPELFQEPGFQNFEPLFKDHEELVMEYWNAWSLDDPTKQFQESQKAAVSLLVATVPPGTHSYNFVVVHLLTTSHAVRILLPMIPSKYHINLVRQWWLLTIAVYLIFECPKIDPDNIKPTDVAGKQWNYVEDKALNSAYSTDAHFVKAIRAIKEAAKTWGDVHEHYLAAAVRFVDDFEGWALTDAISDITRNMAPPAKRLKRNIVTSDDEDPKPVVNTLNNYLLRSPDAKASATAPPENATASPSPTRKVTRLVTRQSSKPTPSLSINGSSARSGKKSTSTSPEKSRARPPTQSKSDEKGKTADLKALFSKQAERAATRPPVKLDDIISDPISDEDDVGEHRATTASHVGLASRKRFKDSFAGNTITSSSIASSQRFIRPTLPPQDPEIDNEQRPWSKRFGPMNLSELAVHTKKVADVRKWLEDVMAGRMRQRLLILKGAAGTGKTTTLRLIAKEMRCEVLEWRNPTTSSRAHQEFQSVSVQFEEFLGRGGKFSQLDLDLEDSSPKNIGTNDNTPKLMLIEEFPNTFARSSTAMTSFRKAILQFLATNTPSLSVFGRQASKDPITPVVMIISETLLTTTSASADSFTAHRLLGPEITRHPGTYTIEFNSIAPTLLSAALGLVVQKEARKSGRRRTPGPLVLKKLGEIGDIRSAISSLQFLCLKGDTEADWGSHVNFGKPKRTTKSSVSLTRGEMETLQLVSQREASLGIFHAIGKVVYNKRGDEPMDLNSAEGRAELLPSHLSSCSRPKRSEVSVDSLVDETGTDTHTFISALHENYVLSCESNASFLDYMGGCIDYLSDSDLLCPSWDVFFGGRGPGGKGFFGHDSASHVLRQEEIAFQVATRGLLFSLPNPVQRKGSGSRRGGGDAFKMFYPTSLKLWREKEELEGLVDHWSSVLLKGDNSDHNLTNGASAFRRAKTAPTSQWLASQHSRQNEIQARQTAQTSDHSTALLSLGSSARREMILERLPYMSHITRRHRSSSSVPWLKGIEKVVSFSGISSIADEDTVDLEENENSGGGAEEDWATDKPTEESSPRKKSFAIRRNGQNGGSVAASQVQKLVLSDDDIEDD
ncbi:cell cycle checkpoint protein RAD17 [Xylaria bambusicola]|uniref:cell cycle checkpoint protein RAD17 n=1 Tax=Xylaria bambusicola TaxID=326684 RepID=UPI00200757E9|nr:cell cycle checkpoint protein RAD17 [Xylaria bambusicola]KAI0508594.1 cell cycle checkpoint protein RAD17 [Xylaria bambusicola]